MAGFATNATNNQTENYPVFMAGNSSFYNQQQAFGGVNLNLLSDGVNSSPIGKSELKRKHDRSPVGSSRTMELTSTPKKIRMIKGLEYEEVDPNLTVKIIQKAYNKTITTVLPNEDDQSFEMYNVVRRLQRNRCIIPFFFRCEACEKIFYVHTVKNHAALTRHFTKCNGPGKHFELNYYFD